MSQYCPLYAFHYNSKSSKSNMASRAKTSVQGSRLPSPHVEEVMESPDESLQSEQDEDLEVSFHPHHTPVPQLIWQAHLPYLLVCICPI